MVGPHARYGLYPRCQTGDPKIAATKADVLLSATMPSVIVELSCDILDRPAQKYRSIRIFHRRARGTIGLFRYQKQKRSLLLHLLGGEDISKPWSLPHQARRQPRRQRPQRQRYPAEPSTAINHKRPPAGIGHLRIPHPRIGSY